MDALTMGAQATERLLALERFGIRLGLDDVSRLCRELGHPERAFQSLHVAGTNGKGSVTAMTHAALVAAGVDAGRYTSPHLSRLHERFVIGRRPVDDAALEAAVDTVLEAADQLRISGAIIGMPTFFEATTAVAFELFRRGAITNAVIEVGLGGRFDATNVISPLAGAITTIGLDHQEHLGGTLEAIAFEKAGIIKPGMTVIVGAVPDRALGVIQKVARERDARVVDARRLHHTVNMHHGRARITVETSRERYGPVDLALSGAHQVSNALVVVGLLEAAAERGLMVSREAIELGLATAQWPARLETLRLANGGRVLLDAAHNVEGAQALAAHLTRWYPERPPLVVGVMSDKDSYAILRTLIPAVSRVIATTAPTPRALPSMQLAGQARLAGATDAIDEPDPVAAVNLALEQADTVCVAGSIFLAGAVRAVLAPQVAPA